MSDRGAASYVAQAKEWEASGEYERAVECYLKVAEPLTQDEALMERSWLKVSRLEVG